MTTNNKDELKTGYIKVLLNYAPKTNGKKFDKWCEYSGFTPLNGGRRAWSSSLSTYLRGADGVAYADGEPFLFCEEDLVDITKQTQEAYKKVDRLEVIDESGRVLVKNNISMELSYQDDGKTLKVFVKELKDE